MREIDFGDYIVEFSGPTAKEKKVLIEKCLKGLKSKRDHNFYQAIAAAEFVGKDKSLAEPILKAFKKRRGWKRRLAFEAIERLEIK